MTDDTQVDSNRDDHWLVRPRTIRRLWWGGGSILAITVALQLVVKVKAYVGVDDWPAFGAVYGFLSCLLMVLVAKVLGVLLKRPEDYYAGEAAAAGHDEPEATSREPHDA